MIGKSLAHFKITAKLGEGGMGEVYVRPTSGRGKWQISSGGGMFPIWSPDGRELFYWRGGGVSVVEIDGQGESLRAGRPEVLFESKYSDLGTSISYDIAPDGKGFVMFEGQDGGSEQRHEHLNFVLNWFPELERTFSQK